MSPPYSNQRFDNVNITISYQAHPSGVDAAVKIDGSVQNCTFSNFKILGGEKPAPSLMWGPTLPSFLGPSWMLWPHHGVLIYWPNTTNNTLRHFYVAHCAKGFPTMPGNVV